ncbi:HAD family hydrolase [Alkalimarinus coralli]|uniref:HAD family hydrolase n=1 Tax=Alkalimarinus coralli TaxID=2935863 RepID=UPI00202AD776|nr:HAD family hydrolase [Alkalimarinus coralli]
MLKALFLDMDETLCDTHGANMRAQCLMAEEVAQRFDGVDGPRFAKEYVAGIYREWSGAQRARYMPIIETQNEEAFRLQLIRDLLAEQGVDQLSDDDAKALQLKFDADRIEAFAFYPGIADFLVKARKLFTLVVITNGPEFSQIPKLEAVNMADFVDHIIIGGQEPAQKPCTSIFEKALKLAGCEAHEAVHVGDSLSADIKGAHNSGITSVWIQHQQPLDAEMGINPHHTVLHPSEIPALIYDLHER